MIMAPFLSLCPDAHMRSRAYSCFSPAECLALRLLVPVSESIYKPDEHLRQTAVSQTRPSRLCLRRDIPPLYSTNVHTRREQSCTEAVFSIHQQQRTKDTNKEMMRSGEAEVAMRRQSALTIDAAPAAAAVTATEPDDEAMSVHISYLDGANIEPTLCLLPSSSPHL